MRAHATSALVVSALLTRHEAARYCHVSLRTFERHVAPAVPHVVIGTKRLWSREDLERWLESQKVGPSVATEGRASSRSASSMRASVTISPRAKPILDRLRPARPSSTRR